MITVFCGDNASDSRAAFQSAVDKTVASGFVRTELEPSALMTQISEYDPTSTLFGSDIVYTTIGLISTLKRSFPRGKWQEELTRLDADTSIHIFDWEEKSAYDLGFMKSPDFIKESRSSANTFVLLPALVPGKKKEFLSILASLTQHQPIEMTLTLISRHVKNMIVAKNGGAPKDSPYMGNVAKKYAQLWDEPRLLALYEGLAKIDLQSKTSSSPLSSSQSLELLALYLL